MDKSNDEKRKIGEKKFIEWLDKRKIPYMYFDQSFKTFSKKFLYLLKRPDFMILIPNLGFIFVDVKNHTIYKNRSGETIAFDIDEIKKFKKLHKKFGVQIWFAVCHESDLYKNWDWISINEIEETDKKEVARLDGKEFYTPQLRKFIRISIEEGIGKLFEK